jgi:hypothetical protein
LLGLLFDPENGGSAFSRNVGELLLHRVTFQKIFLFIDTAVENLKFTGLNLGWALRSV